MRNASKIIWRTVVGAVLASACHHDQPPAAPAPEAAEDACVEDVIFPPESSPDPGDPADGKVIVHVTSTPSGAEVRVADEDAARGVTPLELTFDVAEYREDVTVSAAGHESVTGNFWLGDDRDQAGHFELVATDRPRGRCVEETHFDIGFVVA